ncbi:MAG: VWA domain-containing protein [Pirellulaceae bacterium]|nr:VWA domain-containing protein [Pirellulaceae bacterium]
MQDISITFDHPWMLLLLGALPLLWWVSFRHLAGLGNGRRLTALLLRSTVILLMILALAGLQWVRISQKVSVIYLLDQSDSIARAKRELMLDLVIKSVKRHRQAERGDRSGLIVFGREAAIEFPPFDDDLPAVRGLESYLGPTDATNLEAALKLAQAAFPEDTAKRIVILSDGIETLGQAGPVASSMAQSGIGIDIIPIDLLAGSEVLLEKVDLPQTIRQGQPFQTRVVIQRYQQAGDRPVKGRLRLTRSIGASEQVIVDDAVTLDKDINVFPITDTVQQPAGYIYRAEFIPDDPNDDALQQNNRIESFTYVRGRGRVLLIEDWRSPGDNLLVVDALRRGEIEVDVLPSNQLFTSLSELQAYDCVILAGVPRSSGDAAEDIASFSDLQLDMLVANTEQFGSGLIMSGGPDGLGAGGWTNTVIEKAMPVDFQVKNTKVEAVGALAIILHASEIARGNYWQKRIAEESLKVLGPMDYCGILQYSQLGNVWLWGDKHGMLRVGPNRDGMLKRIRGVSPEDMPDFQPSMQMALSSLTTTPASIKHMIIISDGDPAPPARGLVGQFSQESIKISTVAVGAHGPAGHQTLQDIANQTGGNYYQAANPAALPKIFQREAMRVSRPLIREPEGGVLPQIAYPHELLTGLPRQLPRIKGYVLTTVKDSGLVEQILTTGDSEMETENQTLLATWTYGSGRSAVVTSDMGRRWMTGWAEWGGHDQFWQQLVRWTMRPTQTDAKFSIATNTGDGRVQVVVNALDSQDQFLNFLEMQAVAVGPDLKPISVSMRQAAPGRYIGNFEADNAGSYLINVIPGAGHPPLTAGATVPYSDEYRLRQTNLALLQQLSGLTPRGGQPGQLSAPLDAANVDSLLDLDAYRGGLAKAMSMQDIWPWCVLLSVVCLLGDIFVRRVAVDYALALKWIYARFFGKTVSPQDAQRQLRLDRLRERKTEVTATTTADHSAARFEGMANSEAAAHSLPAVDSTVALTDLNPAAAKQQANSLSADDAQEGYTSRLLAAKKAAQKKNPGDTR